MTSLKQQITERQKHLRDAARLLDPVAKGVVDLVKLMLDDLKESLVAAEGDDMLRLQGAARSLRKLHSELTNEPPGLPVQEKKP